MKIQATLEKVCAVCKAQGEKLTPKRTSVLDVLLRADVPISAYELAERYQKQFGQALPMMSVYRMLKFLMEQELVHKLDTTNHYLVCSHLTCDHPHQPSQFLICDACHQVQEVEIDAEMLNSLIQNMQKVGFKLPSPNLELHGLCAPCQSKQSA